MHTLDPVHARHLVVHQDDMVIICQCLLEGFRPGGDQDKIYLRLPEKLGHYHKIGRRIIHDKYLRIRSLKGLHINVLLNIPLPVQNVQLSHRLVHNDFLRDLNDKS